MRDANTEALNKYLNELEDIENTSEAFNRDIKPFMREIEDTLEIIYNIADAYEEKYEYNFYIDVEDRMNDIIK